MGGTDRGFGAPWGASRSPRAWSREAAGPGAAGARARKGEGSSRAKRRRRTRWPGRRSNGGIFLTGGGRRSARGPGLGWVRVPGGVAGLLNPGRDGSWGGVCGLRGGGPGSGQGPGGAELEGARVLGSRGAVPGGKAGQGEVRGSGTGVEGFRSACPSPNRSSAASWEPKPAPVSLGTPRSHVLPDPPALPSTFPFPA